MRAPADTLPPAPADTLPPDPPAHPAPPHGPADLHATLRERTEERMAQNTGRLPTSTATLAAQDAQRVLHELRVHQIELEMQNEELLAAHQQADEARARYLDLFDTAPVGYVIVSQPGLFLEVNHTAAAMLGAPSQMLVERPLAHFVHPDHQDTLYLHCHRLFESGVAQNCELRLVKHDGTFLWARLDSAITRAPGAQPVWRVMLSDITEKISAEHAMRRKHAELQAMNEDLAVFNNVAVGRELRMIELKQEINALRVAAGQEPRYAQQLTGEPS